MRRLNKVSRQGRSRCGAALGGHIAVAVVIDLQKHFGAVEKAAQRDLMAKEKEMM